MIEHERRFLAKYLPERLLDCPHKEIIDIYVPAGSAHAQLRIRKNGNIYEITKKTKLNEDVTQSKEETIHLTEEEFRALQTVDGKVLHKIRYFYDYKGTRLEIGIYQGPLKGLVMIDAEFENTKDLEAFEKPEFCLIETKGDEQFAGGWLCGKSIEDLHEGFEKYGYKLIE